MLPDPVYGTVVVTKLINQIMYDGKRGKAQAVCYEAFDMVAQKSGQEAMEVFNQALANIMPSLEVKARVWAVPPIRCRSRFARSAGRRWPLRWLVMFARKRGERNISDKLAGEILDAANNTAQRREAPARTCTRWPRRTRPSRITAGNFPDTIPLFSARLRCRALKPALRVCVRYA